MNDDKVIFESEFLIVTESRKPMHVAFWVGRTPEDATPIIVSATDLAIALIRYIVSE